MCWGVCFTSSLPILGHLSFPTPVNVVLTSPPSPFDEAQILIFPLTFSPLYVLPAKLLLSLSALLLFLSSPLLPFPPTHPSPLLTNPSPTPHPHHPPTPPPPHLHHPSQNSPPPPQNPNLKSPSPPSTLQPTHHISPPPTRLYPHIYI